MPAHKFTRENFADLERLGRIELTAELRRTFQCICDSYIRDWEHSDRPTYAGVVAHNKKLGKAVRAVRDCLKSQSQDAAAARRDILCAYAARFGNCDLLGLLEVFDHLEEAAAAALVEYRELYSRGGRPKKAPQIISALAVLYKQAGGTVSTAERSHFYQFVEAILKRLGLWDEGEDAKEFRGRLRTVLGAKKNHQEKVEGFHLRHCSKRQATFG